VKSRDVVRRLEAYAAGKPLPRGGMLRIPRLPRDEVLLLVFLRMGGESRPWGIAWGHPGGKSHFLTVPEPRNRSLVAGMAAEFAPAFLGHFCHPLADPGPYDRQNPLPIRQLWLPNASHIDMLHHLGYAYSFTRHGEDLRPRLNALGRTATWAFLESQRPGQLAVINASRALSEAHAFPADDLHLAHLGFELAMLSTAGTLAARYEAAMEAEQWAVSTSLDPTLEEETLGPFVDDWNRAQRTGDGAAVVRAAGKIDRTLRDELRRRLLLLGEAHARLEDDPRSANPGLALLQQESRASLWWDLVRPGSGTADGVTWILSPETDRNPAAAASRYLLHCRSQLLERDALLPHDPELLTEARAAGDVLVGELTEVRRDDPSMPLLATWVLGERDPVPLHLRDGDRVRFLGLPHLTGQIRSIARLADGSRVVHLQVKSEGRGNPAAGNYTVKEPGSSKPRRITLISDPMLGLLERRRELTWENSGPGAWLTHRDPGGVRDGPDAEEGANDDPDPPLDEEAAADSTDGSAGGTR
jgi:hypothetical protein